MAARREDLVNGRKKVKMWMDIEIGDFKFGCAEEVEVPEGCFAEDGTLIEEDVIEYVEEWIQERCHWGATILPVEESS